MTTLAPKPSAMRMRSICRFTMRMYAARKTPSVVPSATLPKSSCPRLTKAVAEKLARASTRGRATPIARATSAMTKTSHVMTKASVNDASGPAARVCDRTPRVAEGLRGVASTAHRIATPMSGATGNPCTNGMNRRIARKVPAAPIRLNANCASMAQPRLPIALRTSRRSSSAPPASAMSDSASVFTGASVSTVLLVDDVEDVRTGDDAGQKVARDVRQPDELQQLARDGPREQQEPDGGDDPEPARSLRDDARRIVR